MSNERAETWLRELGYKPEPEPAWITGRKPDFFCPDDTPLWVEVKTLDEPNYLEQMGRAWDDLRERCADHTANGSIHALIGGTYDEQAGKTGLAAAARTLCEPAVAGQVRVVVVPGDPDYSRTVRLEYGRRSGEAILQTGPASRSGRYPYYSSLEPEPWSTELRLAHLDGRTECGPAFKLLDGRVPFKLAMRLFPSDKPMRVSSVGAGEAQRNRTQTRVRDVVADANQQLRSGQGQVPAPGLVVVFHDSSDAGDDSTILAAMFGDLTIPIDRGEMGDAYLGRNGVLSPTKNGGVSAVRYVGYRGNPVTVVNPWAQYPIDRHRLSESAWLLDGEKFTKLAR